MAWVTETESGKRNGQSRPASAEAVKLPNKTEIPPRPQAVFEKGVFEGETVSRSPMVFVCKNVNGSHDISVS